MCKNATHHFSQDLYFDGKDVFCSEKCNNREREGGVKNISKGQNGYRLRERVYRCVKRDRYRDRH